MQKVFEEWRRHSLGVRGFSAVSPSFDTHPSPVFPRMHTYVSPVRPPVSRIWFAHLCLPCMPTYVSHSYPLMFPMNGLPTSVSHEVSNPIHSSLLCLHTAKAPAIKNLNAAHCAPKVLSPPHAPMPAYLLETSSLISADTSAHTHTHTPPSLHTPLCTHLCAHTPAHTFKHTHTATHTSPP